MVFDARSIPGISMASRLPKQTNQYDCGLFLLSYIDFFVAADPQCIVSQGSNASGEHRSRLWHLLIRAHAPCAMRVYDFTVLVPYPSPNPDSITIFMARRRACCGA